MVIHPVGVATLSPEDLQRWRTWSARNSAIQAAPALYNRDEIEAHFRAEMTLWAEFAEHYDFEDCQHLCITSSSGVIWHEDDD